MKIYTGQEAHDIAMKYGYGLYRPRNPQGPYTQLTPPPNRFRDNLLVGNEGIYVSPEFLRNQYGQQYVANHGGRVYVDRNNPVEQVAIQKPGEQSFWSNPQRIARYYHAAKTLPPGSVLPQWYDNLGIDLAYKVMESRNGGQPWYNWTPLEPDDPANDLLNNIAVPPPEAMASHERNEFYGPAWTPTREPETFVSVDMADAQKELTPEQIAVFHKFGENKVLVPSSYLKSYWDAQQPTPLELGPGGMPLDEYNKLAGWQKAIVSASPWLNTALGVGGGALTGLFMFGPMGALAGGIAGGLFARAAEGGIDPETGQPTNTIAGDLARAGQWMGQGAAWAEQGVGVLGQIASSIVDPDRYGPVQEILNNLGAAFEAGKLTYEASFSDVFGKQITPQGFAPQAGKQPWETGGILGPVGETWKVPQGGFASSLALAEARRRIAAGESSTKVYDDITGRFGISGTVRDTVLQMIIDPLNMMGDVLNGVGYKTADLAGNKVLAESFKMRSQLATLPENFRRGLEGEKLLDAGNMFSNDVIDAIRIYGSKIRQMPTAEAVQFGAVSRWLAGLDKAGKPTYMDQTRRKGLVGLADHMRGLTPQARAHEELAHAVDGFQQLIADENDEGLIYAHLQQIAGMRPEQGVEALENNPLPRWYSSAEAQGLIAAQKDVQPLVKELHDRWTTTRPAATVLQRVADMMDVDVHKLMADLHNAEPKDAATIYRTFVQSLEERAKASDTVAAKLLETLRKDTSFTQLDGVKLKGYAELFMGKDGAPFEISMYKAQLFHMLTDNMEKWAVKYFGVKPANWAYRTAELVKRAQGKVLLGLNPLFLINNALNNLVTLGWDGLLEWLPAKTRMRFLRELGVKPVRLRAGSTAAEIGEDMLTSKDLGGYQLGSQIRRASRAGDTIQALDDLVRRADKFPDFATISQKFERWSSEIATVSAMRRYWPQVWREGVGITEMWPDLERALEAFSPGISKKVKRAIQNGKSKAQIEKLIFQDLGTPKLRDVLTRQENDLLSHLPGLVDEIDDRLATAQTDEDIRSVFTDAWGHAQGRIQSMVQRNMRRMTVEAKEKVQIEGHQGMLDLFDRQMQNRAEYWLFHLDEMDELAADASKLKGSARKAMWQQGLDRADRNWKTMGNIEGSMWLGAVEAMSGSQASPEYVRSLNNWTDQHANWENFYQTRRELMDAFYAASEGADEETSSRLWHETNQKLNAAYVDATIIEDELQGELDGIFAELYARQFPDNPNAWQEAMNWRGAVQGVRRRMAATQVLLRTGGAVPAELEDWLRMIPKEVQDQVMNLTKAIPPYAMGKKERERVMKEFMTGIYAPYIREMLEASNAHAPMQPTPRPSVPPPAVPPAAAMPQPTVDIAPPEAAMGSGNVIPDEARRQPSPEAALPIQEEPTPPPAPEPEPPASKTVISGEPGQPEPDRLATPEEVQQLGNLIHDVAEMARAEQTAVFKIASEHGIGSDTPAGRKHIINILKQYFRVDSIADVSPEMAREAFAKRDLFKGAIDREAQERLDRRILEWRQRVMRENQQQLALATPKTFTRDALYRVAEEQIGTEKAELYMQWHDLLAEHWAGLEPGRTVEQWYEAQAWDLPPRYAVAGVGDRFGLINARTGEQAAGPTFPTADEARSHYAQVLADMQEMEGLAQLDTSTPDFQRKFTGSKIVDETGKPLRVYHATTADFTQFSDNPPTRNTRHGTNVMGIYFTESPAIAGDFLPFDPNAWPLEKATGSRLIPVYLDIKNPYEMDSGAFLRLRSPVEAYQFMRRLKYAGYDGIIVRADPSKVGSMLDEFSARQFVVFDHKQIINAMTGGLMQLAPEEGVRYRVDSAIRALESAMRAAGEDELGIDATLRKYGQTLVKMPVYSERVPYWNELYEYASAMRAENYLNLTGHVYGPEEEIHLTSLQGKGLFQGKKGITRWISTGQAMVRAFEAADVYTFIHETAHVWLPQMPQSDIDILAAAYKAEKGIDLPQGWQYGHETFVDVKEWWARSVERYNAEGRAPTPALRRLFEKFKAWAMEIYGKITGSQIDVQLSPEVVDLIDRWMGKKPEAARPVTPDMLAFREKIRGTDVYKRAAEIDPEAVIEALRRGPYEGREEALQAALAHYDNDPAMVLAMHSEGMSVILDLGGMLGGQAKTATGETIAQVQGRAPQSIIGKTVQDLANQATAAPTEPASLRIVQQWGRTALGNGEFRYGVWDGGDWIYLSKGSSMLSGGTDRVRYDPSWGVVPQKDLDALASHRGEKGKWGLRAREVEELQRDPQKVIDAGKASEAARASAEAEQETFTRNLETATERGYGVDPATLTKGDQLEFAGDGHIGRFDHVAEDGTMYVEWNEGEAPVSTRPNEWKKIEGAAPAETPITPAEAAPEIQVGTRFDYSGKHFVVDKKGQGPWWAVRYEDQPEGTVQGMWAEENIQKAITNTFDYPEGEMPAPATPEVTGAPFRVVINEVGKDGLTAAERARLTNPQANPPAASPEPALPTIEPQIIEKPAPFGATIQRNAQHEGIEVSFPEKPDAETIKKLKDQGYRWSSRQKVWYKKERRGDWERLDWLRAQHEIAPEAPAHPVPVSPEKAAVIGADHWPTWDEYRAEHPHSLHSDYFAMIKQAVRAGELGYEDAVPLIGETGAKAGMFTRYTDQAETFTQAQFLNAVEPYYNKNLYDQGELVKLHYDTIANMMAAGKQFPDEILRDYPDLVITKEPPAAPPTSIWDGTEKPQPGLFNAPEGQMSLFGEETAGFGLEAQRAPNEQFNPPEGQQLGLFGLGEYTEAPKKPATPEAAGGAGPLFEQPAQPVEPEIPAPAPTVHYPDKEKIYKLWSGAFAVVSNVKEMPAFIKKHPDEIFELDWGGFRLSLTGDGKQFHIATKEGLGINKTGTWAEVLDWADKQFDILKRKEGELVDQLKADYDRKAAAAPLHAGDIVEWEGKKWKVEYFAPGTFKVKLQSLDDPRETTRIGATYPTLIQKAGEELPAASPETAVPARATIQPGDTFEVKGRRYQMKTPESGEVVAEDLTGAYPIRRAWYSVDDFEKSTGLKLDPDTWKPEADIYASQHNPYSIGDIVRYKGKEYEVGYAKGGHVQLDDLETHQRAEANVPFSLVEAVRKAGEPAPEIPRPDLKVVELGREFRTNDNHSYRLVHVEPGNIRAIDLQPPYHRTPRVFERTWSDLATFEKDTGQTLPAKLTQPIDKEDLRLAVREKLLGYLEKHPDATRSDVVDMFKFSLFPGYSYMDISQLFEYLGKDVVKETVDDAMFLASKPQPPVDVPITIQPNGVDQFMQELYKGGESLMLKIQKPRDFEELAQQLMGLDMNDETNLNLAYDTLEGAFNLAARDTIRGLEIVEGRPLTLNERLKALASLEGRLTRARRTISKMHLQQFSTPLTISDAAGYAADVRPGDVVLEPTAGTGNLVNRFAGRDDLVVRTNEIDEGRRQVLRAQGYDPTNMDIQSAEWVISKDGKRLPPMASAAVINPPWGAYSTGKYGTAMNVPVKLNDWSQRFTYLIMQRMSEGSRLSGVMPTNWVYTMDRATREITPHRSEFLRWLDQHYWVRAVIESPPDAYAQRGTNIGSLLVVVDKSPKPEGALPAIEAWGENAPKTWDAYAALVKELGEGGTHERSTYDIRTSQSFPKQLADDEINARRPVSGPDATGLVDPNARTGEPSPAPGRIGKPTQPGLGDATHTATSIGDLLTNRGAVLPSGRSRTGAGGELITEPPARPVEGNVGERTSPSGAAGVSGYGGEPGLRGGPGEPNAPAAPGAGEQPARTPMVEGQPAEVPGGIQPEPRPGTTTGRSEPAQPELRSQPTERLAPVGEPAGRYVESAEDIERRRAATTTIEQAGGFTLYVGRSPLTQGEPRHAHPSTVVETKALSGVKAPDLEEAYRPSPAVMDAYNRGDLSLEGQLDPVWAAVQQNDKNHMGMLVADDVGMGKSRTGAAFVLDRIEKGRKRILVVTKDSRNLTNLMENEFPLVGGGKFPAEMVLVSGETMPGVKNAGEAIPTFNDRPAVYFVNAYQLPSFEAKIRDLRVDAVVIDEVHNFKNIDDTAARAHAWLELHKDWLSRDVSMLYLSATPGSDIADLQYLYGLKIWTMDGFPDWVGVITGKISPEQAKKVDAAKATLTAWVQNLQKAVDDLHYQETGRNIDYDQQIGIDLGNGLFAYQKKMDDEWQLIGLGKRSGYDGEYTRFTLTRDQKNRILLTGKILKEQNPNADFATLDSYPAREMLLRAQDEFEKRYPTPNVDRETLGNLGMHDTSDAVQVVEQKIKGWGTGRTAFESTIPPEHTEQIMRELKVGGSYMSRDISRLGVTFEVLKVDVPPERVAAHNQRIDLYRRIITAFHKWGKFNEGPKKAAAMFGVIGDIQADAKRAMFDMRLPEALRLADEAIQRGEQVVLSVVSVGDADIDKGGNLASAMEKINTVKVKKVKSGGEVTFTDPEDLPEALIEVADIKDELRQLGPLRSPVDIIKEHFGNRVAFITGSENDKNRLAAMKDFQNNRLDVVVISKAGKEGINLHDVTGKRKVHLIVADYEWSATNFKQELGRVDRTGQKSSPTITVLHTGNAGEVKFVSTIANRMKGLGATSKGGAESTGTGALNEEFELGSLSDKLALRQTWGELSREQKSHFVDRWFDGQNTPGEKRREIPATAEAIKKFTLALQSMKVQEANEVLDIWMKRRQEMMQATAADVEAKKMMSRGAILRKTPLGNNLELIEARDQANHRFGVLTGVLTPHMNKVAGIFGAAANLISIGEEGELKSWREWINFRDTNSGEYASGLVIPPGKIERVAKEFGQAFASHRTPETALIDIKAGDRIPIRGQEGAEWALYMGRGGFREGKVIVDGARMVYKDPLMKNGAVYDARGNFFYVPEEKVQDFIKRFPMRDAAEGLAQVAQPGETFAFGPSGERYQFRYKVVALDDLIQSHLDTFDPNPRYPAELQPRARDRAAYREQVQQIASGLDERMLTETHQVDSGTPIVGVDNIVENGNGRIMGLRRARMDYPDRWNEYQDQLRAKLGDFGLTDADLTGVKDPVLVRERMTDVDRVKFAGEAQASQSMQLTVDELAGSDSKYVDTQDLTNLTINDEQTIEGALRSPANRDLVNAFLNKIPAGEKSAFLAPDGSLSLDGLTRLRNAIFVAVYPGDAGRRLADAFLVSQSEAVSNIRAAIFDTLAPMSQAEALIREGRRDADLSITDDIARAVDQYVRLKQQGASVRDYVNQPGLLEKPTNPLQDRLLQFIDENSRSRRKLRNLMALYADNVINVQQDPNQMSLFGEARASKYEILDAAAESVTGKTAGFEEVAPQPAAREMPPEIGTPIEAAASPEPEMTPAEAQPETAMPTEPQPIPAAAAPLGTAEHYQEPPTEEAAFEGWMKEVEPTLRRAQAAVLDPTNRRAGVFDLDRDLDPATKKQLRKYLGQVGADLTDAKLATIRYGEMRRDAALLNYGARTGADNFLGTIFPYEFWTTRSMMNWALRALSRPSVLANYARLRNLQQKYMEGEGNLPTRLKDKVKIPVPFLPDWMGDGVYIDPMKQLFPFMQMLRPWEQLAQQKNMEIRKTESALDRMVQDEQISENQAAQAKQTHQGAIWQKALAQARQDMEEDIASPLDFAFMVSSPSLPASIAYNVLKGTPEKIGQLPITRLIQANTAALGLGGPRGFNIEQPIRKATGLPEIDEFEDYRVDRMLANLVAEGQISLDDAERAMLDREGDAFTMAQRRVSSQGIMNYWGAPLGVDLFPEGESDIRSLKKEYDIARKHWADGTDPKALTKFYDEHPEYEARNASFRDPEERLRTFLRSEIWDKYMNMPDLYKRQAREQLGKTFTDAFLDKETRSYDSINTTTLASWAQMLGANNPKVAPEAPQTNIEFAEPAVAQAVQGYYDQGEANFPKHGMVEQAMYLLPEDQRAAFEAQYPQLQAFYKWKDRYLADNPGAIPWVISQSNELYGLPNDVQAYVYNYRARQEDMFPGIYDIQDGYYAQSSSKAKSAYLKKHPELPKYWSWRREVAAAYPAAAPYILSDTTMQKAILGDEYTAQQPQLSAADLSMLTPTTQRALMANVYSGEDIRAGALQELESVWISMGRPYGTLEKWISKAVKPALSQ